MAPSAARPPDAAVRGCRVLTVQGKAERGVSALVQGDVTSDDWLSLAPEARVQLKHVRTGREFTIHGPARLIACRRGEESLEIARGRAHATSGAGARPGAQVLLATPDVALLYGDAELEVVAEPAGTRVHVIAGEMWRLSSGDPPTLLEVEPKRGPVRLPKSPPPNESVARCQRLSQRSSELAREVLGSPSPRSEAWAELVQQHVLWRRNARLTCAQARAAAGALTHEPERRQLEARLNEIERLWR